MSDHAIGLDEMEPVNGETADRLSVTTDLSTATGRLSRRRGAWPIRFVAGDLPPSALLARDNGRDSEAPGSSTISLWDRTALGDTRFNPSRRNLRLSLTRANTPQPAHAPRNHSAPRTHHPLRPSSPFVRPNGPQATHPRHPHPGRPGARGVRGDAAGTAWVGGR